MAGILKVMDIGLGVSIQDGGRRGWRRFGVPPGGFMDAHAAACANALLENAAEAPVLEMLLQGQKFRVEQSCWVACCGAEVQANIPLKRAVHLRAGEAIRFANNSAGVWVYLAVAGGIDAPKFFGSSSYYARGNIGQAVKKGDFLKSGSTTFSLPQGVSGRTVHWQDAWDLCNPPIIRLWPGPQFSNFSAADRQRFCSAEWAISAQSDRVGYRLTGPKLAPVPNEIISEPVLVGSIQVPENGQPLVTMPDGPTVGGYPKLGLVHSEDLCWVAQTRPGQKLRFTFINAPGPQL